MTGNRKISKQEPDASIEKDWTQNKSLSGIDPAKLQFLNSIAAQGIQMSITYKTHKRKVAAQLSPQKTTAQPKDVWTSYIASL